MVADERFANPVGIMQGGFLAAFAEAELTDGEGSLVAKASSTDLVEAR
jgi:acyl-coenzyme A thioesterase PaaI-like protein